MRPRNAIEAFGADINRRIVHSNIEFTTLRAQMDEIRANRAKKCCELCHGKINKQFNRNRYCLACNSRICAGCISIHLSGERYICANCSSNTCIKCYQVGNSRCLECDHIHCNECIASTICGCGTPRMVCANCTSALIDSPYEICAKCGQCLCKFFDNHDYGYISSTCEKCGYKWCAECNHKYAPHRCTPVEN